MPILINQKTFPRLLIAGTSSGVGKTTISLAIMAALSGRGFKVQGFKVGPDFIDPGYYQMATGRPGRNLDMWMMGKENSKACFIKAATDVDVSIIEGVMGLYDGREGFSEGSTADTAKTTASPVVLVIDCAKMGSSAGAIALGYLKYDEDVNICGFILNNIGSDKHRNMVKTSVERATGLPVLGCIRRNTDVNIPERHLGLVTQTETSPADSYKDALVELAGKFIDLDALLEIGGKNSTKLLSDSDVFSGVKVRRGENLKKIKLGIAYDEAFSFYYHDNFDLLEAFGAELVFFSPLKDKHIPTGLNGIYLGGGYPEVYAEGLSGNTSIAYGIRNAVEDGMPVYAECGGLIYLSQSIEDFNGNTYGMSKSLPITCKMQSRPTLGYREVITASDSIIAEIGETLRGHEFHYSSIINAGKGLHPVYKMENNVTEGFIYKNTLASYVHLHFAGKPEVAKRFVSACK